MGRLVALRLAARLARREVRRRPGRTALVALLIAVPTAGMTVAAALVRTEHRTPQQSWEAQHGAADAVLHTSPTAESADVLTLLPAGSRVSSYTSDFRLLETRAGNRATTMVSSLPMVDPLTRGVVTVLDGRPAQKASEVFLSRSTARRLDAGVGATLQLVRPADMRLDVVGVGERRASWGADLAVLGPGTPFPWGDSAGVTHAIDLPEGFDAGPLVVDDGRSALQLAPSYGLTRSWSEGGPDDVVAWSWVIGALVLVVVGIVVASAFAAGARRQLTTIGQLSGNGASPSTVRRVLLLQGTWTGLVGVVAGFALGAAALVALAPHMDELLNRDVDPYTVRITDMLPIALLGIAAATIAALVPARTMSRVSVLAALAGRRPLQPVPRWLTPAGVLLCISGLALLALAVLGGNTATSAHQVWALTAVAGGVGVLLGACTITPGYVTVLDPIANRVRGAWRLAARSLIRQRTRTGAVVSAICATSALAIAAAALVLGAIERFASEPQFMADNQVQVVAAPAYLEADVVAARAGAREAPPTEPPAELLARVERVVGEADRRELTALGPPGAGSADAPWYIVGALDDSQLQSAHFGGQAAVLADDDAVAAYGLSSGQRHGLERAGALAFASGERAGNRDGDVTIAWMPAEGMTGDEPVLPPVLPPNDAADWATFPAVAVDAVDAGGHGSLPRLVVTAETARRFGLVVTSRPVVFETPQPLTAEQRAGLAAISEDLHADQADTGFAGADVSLSWHEPSGDLPPLALEGILTGVALIFAVFVITVSLALAAAETRDERDVLAVVGAAPRVLVKTSGNKALILTLLGAVLAVPVGLLPVAVFTLVSNTDVPFVFPWRTVGLLLTAAPAVAWGVTTLGSAVATRVRPIHVSTMAFD